MIQKITVIATGCFRGDSTGRLQKHVFHYQTGDRIPKSMLRKDFCAVLRMQRKKQATDFYPFFAKYGEK
jgi:hypothetical protein